MTVTNHTAIPGSPKQPANAAIFNAPLGQLDAAIGDLTALTTTPKTSVVAALGATALGTTATTVSGAIAELGTSVGGVLGGAEATAQTLKQWAEGEDYEPTAITWDADNVVATATVKWPDGSAGTFTTTSKNSTWLAIDAYTISHTASGLTVTQATVTRDANGNIAVKPPLTVA